MLCFEEKTFKSYAVAFIDSKCYYKVSKVVNFCFQIIKYKIQMRIFMRLWSKILFDF